MVEVTASVPLPVLSHASLTAPSRARSPVHSQFTRQPVTRVLPRAGSAATVSVVAMVCLVDTVEAAAQAPAEPPRPTRQ